MRQLVFHGAGDLRWEEAPEPRLQDDRDVLVRPVAVARCDLDAPIAMGLYPMAPPFPMGHEMVGEVVDRGDDAGDVVVGDLVVVPFQISCGACAMCVRGFTGSCESVPPGSSFGLAPQGHVYGGALSDLVRVPFADHLLLPLPDGVDPVVACNVPDNVCDGYRTVAGPMRRWPDEPVLVVGGLAQSVGVFAAASAVALGAPRVVYVDQDAERLRLAAAFGAEAVEAPLDDLPRDERFAVTVDASGLDQGREHAIRSTKPNGTCTSVSGGVAPRAPFPLPSMYAKGITYEVGRVHARATAPEVLDLVASGTLDPGIAIGRTVPFDGAVEAMTAPDVKLVLTADG